MRLCFGKKSRLGWVCGQAGQVLEQPSRLPEMKVGQVTRHALHLCIHLISAEGWKRLRRPIFQQSGQCKLEPAFKVASTSNKVSGSNKALHVVPKAIMQWDPADAYLLIIRTGMLRPDYKFSVFMRLTFYEGLSATL